MKYKLVQQLIQELDDGKDAEDVVKTFVEGKKKEEVEEKPETRVEEANLNVK